MEVNAIEGDRTRPRKTRVGLALALVGLPLTACLACGAYALWPRTSPEEHFVAHRVEFQHEAERALDRVEAGTTGDEVWLQLSQDSAHLSDGGEFVIEWRTPSEPWVFFFRTRGLLGEGVQYVYCPATPAALDELTLEFDEARPLGGEWYLVQEY